jgi:RHS repeat-associated protein
LETKNDTKAPSNVTKFDGQYLDATGLYHMRARQYDSSAGRFTTPDPLTPIRAFPYASTYAFVYDRPMMLVDPSGMGAVGNTCSTLTCFITERAVPACLKAINPLNDPIPVGADIAKSAALRRWAGAPVANAFKTASIDWVRDVPVVTVFACLNAAATSGY